MDAIITGGTSFIGLAVTKELLNRGWRVWSVVRPDSPHKNRLPAHDNLQVIELSLEEIEKLPEELTRGGFFPEESPVFLHMAWGGVGSAGRSDPTVQQKNIDSSLETIRAAAATGCRRFLFSGSQAEYGLCRELTAEGHPCEPVSEYGKAKLEFCRRAEKLCETYHMEYIHTRIFSVYGPGDHPWSLVSSCLSAFQEGRHMELGECTQRWNFLYIDDMAKALAALMECRDREIGGIYNIAGNETKVLRRFVEEMYQSCGEKGSYTYGRRPPNAEGPASLLPDIRKIERVTGWKPAIPFHDGIRMMLEKAENQELLTGENRTAEAADK